MDTMLYIWCALVGVAVGSMLGRFIPVRGFSVFGDILFGVTGAVIFGAGFKYLGYVPESGLVGALIMASIGAIGSVVLRRTLNTV